jgi:hypothetical protein
MIKGIGYPSKQGNSGRRGFGYRLARKESPAEAGQVHPGRKIKMKRANTNTKSRLF